MKFFHYQSDVDLDKLILFDVMGTVAKLRKDRVGMVQTKVCF